jgi:nitrite reductase/ring-hydroxylating ferredoxin subunit
MATNPQSRRTFLATLTLLLGSTALLLRYLTPVIPPKRRVLARAALADIPAGGALVYREARLALFRDDHGVYALSLVCTHLGCTVNVGAGGIDCPCHGSRFDRRGMVLQGPADQPLRRLHVEVTGDVVEVMAG